MKKIETIESNFRVIPANPYYVLVEDYVSEVLDIDTLIKDINNIISYCEHEEVKLCLFNIKKENPNYKFINEILLGLNFTIKKGEYIIVKGPVDKVTDPVTKLSFLCVKDAGKEVFLDTWSKCIIGTKEEKSRFTMEEQFEAMVEEIGNQYLETFHIVYEEDYPIGIVTPMIEANTDNKEGRIFYTGLIPSARGKKYGSIIFQKTLFLLKNLGAEYVIDGTEGDNKALLRIFDRHHLEIIGHDITFFKEFIYE